MKPEKQKQQLKQKQQQQLHLTKVRIFRKKANVTAGQQKRLAEKRNSPAGKYVAVDDRQLVSG